MNWAIWYYDETDFPVLQAVYPDLEDRFPEDSEFDKGFEQPLMQPAAPMTRVEGDFWASTDPKSSLFNWKFPILRTRESISPRRSTMRLSLSHTSHTMLKMGPGSFSVAAWRMDVALHSPAFTIRSTATPAWLN